MRARSARTAREEAREGKISREEKRVKKADFP
jgi:hypothetical protein